MSVYHISGNLYDAITRMLTQGRLRRFKQSQTDLLGVEPHDRVLDWGCGTGASAQVVLPHLHGQGTIYAVDVSPKMMRKAIARCQPQTDLSFQFFLREGFQTQLPEPADVAIACHSLGVLPSDQIEMAVHEIWRNLKPQGKILITDMYIPEPKSRFMKIRTRLVMSLGTSLFGQNFSGDLQRVVERYFEPQSLTYLESMMAYAIVGIRRDEPSGAA